MKEKHQSRKIASKIKYLQKDNDCASCSIMTPLKAETNKRLKTWKLASASADRGDKRDEATTAVSQRVCGWWTLPGFWGWSAERVHSSTADSSLSALCTARRAASPCTEAGRTLKHTHTHRSGFSPHRFTLSSSFHSHIVIIATSSFTSPHFEAWNTTSFGVDLNWLWFSAAESLTILCALTTGRDTFHFPHSH